MPLNQTARYRATSAQVAPWVFPQPIAATCPTCVVSAASTSGTSLWIPALSQALYAPAVVVDTGAGVLAWSLGTMLPPDAASEFPVPVGTVVSAYLTGLDVNGASVTEQLVVDAM